MASLRFEERPGLRLGSNGVWVYTSLGPDRDTGDDLKQHIFDVNRSRAQQGDPLVQQLHRERIPHHVPGDREVVFLLQL